MQGTGTVQLHLESSTFTKRRYAPFGVDRSPEGTAGWTGDRGFLNKTEDQLLGTTHVGAREYDNRLGRFLSPDPIAAPGIPQQLNAYAYANNNPLAYADPSGLFLRRVGSAVRSAASRTHAAASRPNSSRVSTASSAGRSAATTGVRAGNSSSSRGISLNVSGGGGVGRGTIGIGYSVTSTARASAGAEIGAINPWKSCVEEFQWFDCATDLYVPAKGVKTGWNGLRALGRLFGRGQDSAGRQGGVGTTTGIDNATTLWDNGLGPMFGCAPSNSFVPETRVLTADGSTKAIEDIEVGDMVWATDPETGEEGPREVIALIEGDGEKELVEITVDGETIVATAGHPFWVPQLGQWIEAGDLETGDVLQTGAGTVVQIQAIDIRVEDDARVHNLTVDDLHTYYVVAGRTPLLVHNCGNYDPLTDEELQHVIDRHTPGCIKVDERSGLFDLGQDLEDLYQRGSNINGSINLDTGSYETKIVTDRIIGVTGDRKMPTNAYVIVHDRFGQFRTIYPVMP